MLTVFVVLLHLVLQNPQSAGAAAPMTPCPHDLSGTGKIVALRGIVESGPHGFTVFVDGCGDEVKIAMPDTIPGMLDVWGAVIRQKDYREVYDALSAKDKRGWKYSVRATVMGVLDVSERAGPVIDPVTKKVTRYEGFGSPFPYTRYRLFLLGVSDVAKWKSGTPDPGDAKEPHRDGSQQKPAAQPFDHHAGTFSHRAH